MPLCVFLGTGTHLQPALPQKLNDFAKVVRGLHIEDALIQVRVYECCYW